jgi:hypothetical protein
VARARRYEHGMRHTWYLVGAIVVGCSSSSDRGGADDGATPAGEDAGAPESGTVSQKDGAAARDTGAKACSLGIECGDRAVCDPDTAVCVSAQCDITAKPCASGKTCAQQESHVVWGACYVPCIPVPAPGKTTGCPDGYECEIGSFDAASGTCRKRGPTGADQVCTFSDVTTSCVAGYTCQPDPKQHFCRQTCDFFAQNGPPTCARPELHCMAPGNCYSDQGDPAKVGEPCTGAQNMPCGLDGQAYKGVCAQDVKTPSRNVCSKWCRTSKNECDAGQACQPTSMPSLGYCQ